MTPSDFPSNPPRLFISVFGWTRPYCEGSQTTDQFVAWDLPSSWFHFLHPLFRSTPDRSSPACVCCFGDKTCLHPVWKAGHDLLDNEAINRIHFRYGWRLCLNESQHRELLPDTVTRLHVKQTITWQKPFILQVKPSFAWRFHTAHQTIGLFLLLRDFIHVVFFTKNTKSHEEYQITQISHKKPQKEIINRLIRCNRFFQFICHICFICFICWKNFVFLRVLRGEKKNCVNSYALPAAHQRLDRLFKPIMG